MSSKNFDPNPLDIWALLLIAIGLAGVIWLFSTNVHGQTNPICKERGHIPSGWGSTTLLYCPDYYEDTDSTTVLVHPGCNSITYACQRCGVMIKTYPEDTRTVIWRRGDKKPRPQAEEPWRNLGEEIFIDTLGIMPEFDSISWPIKGFWCEPDTIHLTRPIK